MPYIQLPSLGIPLRSTASRYRHLHCPLHCVTQSPRPAYCNTHHMSHVMKRPVAEHYATHHARLEQMSLHSPKTNQAIPIHQHQDSANRARLLSACHAIVVCSHGLTTLNICQPCHRRSPNRNLEPSCPRQKPTKPSPSTRTKTLQTAPDCSVHATL